MADYSLIADHPLSKEILRKILAGTTPKEISQWLKIKYPDKNQSHLRLSAKVLTDFKDSQYTTLHEQFQEDKALVANASDPSELPLSLQNNKSYREALQEIADKELNTTNVLQGNIGILLVRLEQIYDLIQQDPSNLQHDYKLTGLFKTVKEGIDTLEKIKNNSLGAVTDHNMTMQAVHVNMAIMQDAIRETLYEIDPELVSKFMEKLINKANAMESEFAMTPHQKESEINNFGAQVVETLNEN